MMKTLTLLFSLLLFSCIGYAQSSPAQSEISVEIIAITANVRGTPDMQGIVVTTAVKGDVFELITTREGWYLVQTPKYVGWMHGNLIKLIYGTKQVFDPPPVMPTVPQTTSKPPSSDSPFRAEYTGSTDPPDVTIINESSYNLTLNLGGVKYGIPANSSKLVTLSGGNYEFDASASGVRRTSGVAKFSVGYLYSWRFYVRTVSR